jgi:sugar fermentation stimulation protein A
MKLELLPATFLKRYKRFLCDVKVGKEIWTVHCPNSGSMKTLLEEGSPCFIHDSQNPKRKLRYTLTLMGVGDKDWALIDTQRPNAMAEEAIQSDLIPELSGYTKLRREVKYGKENSRIDLLLEEEGRPLCYVEVKNNTMLSSTTPGRSDFPDAVTERGRKHLRELMEMKAEGNRAVLLLMVNRTDANRAGIASEIDPAYADTLKEAMEAGVEVLCYRSKLSPELLEVSHRIAFDLPWGRF